MQFGIFLPHQLPRPWPEGAEREIFLHSLEQGELADHLGIDFAWGQEHHFLEEYAHSSAPEVYLAALSQRTRRIRIGHGVVLMSPRYNPPARIAERLATLDLLSGGRVEWGTGESGTRVELEGFGVSVLEKREMWAETVRETAKMLSMEPYPGYQGRFFSMPARNVVPKPLQRPHPPLWVACSSREAVRHAARAGIGALTFSFLDAAEARYWVDEYYETFKRECTPIGRAVNPNIAMLTNFMCHRDPGVAAERGLTGARFFAFGLAHYYRDGTHVPGETDLWERFQRAPERPHAGTGGIGDPASVRAHFGSFEEAGVDQLILLQQAGGYRHEHICESLSLFGAEVLPRFRERHEARARRKAEELAPYIERAMRRIPPLERPARSTAVESYPVLARRRGVAPGAPAARPDHLATFVDLVRARAAHDGDRVALTYLSGDGAAHATWSFAELDRRARAIAVRLLASARPGDRALLLYPAGGEGGAAEGAPALELLAAFHGCLYAGVIAVPAYPPRADRGLLRLLAIAKDAGASLALSTSDVVARREGLFALAPGLRALEWIATDAVDEGADAFRPPAVTGASVAFLQYTSGSTRSPRGVMVSHENLLHNTGLFERALGPDARSVILGWLPLYHDLGLVGHALAAMYSGIRCVLMSPLDFARRPLSWLRAISEHRATMSGAPNFAFELCVRRLAEATDADPLAGLDLSCWQVALDGAEPVRADTLDRFAAAFAPAGLRREALYPCYGLAEATAFAAGNRRGTPARIEHVDAAALERHTVARTPAGGPTSRALVGCGEVPADQRIRIVDPSSGRECPADHVGEIWIAGPSVALGYWGNPEETARAFGARLADSGEGPCLRTGDLGFLAGGELFITGRLKDLVLVRGRNHYPQDLEWSAEHSHRALRPGCSAAFAFQDDGEERLGLVVEVEPAGVDVEEIVTSIRAALLEEHEVQVAWITLLPPRAIPKTSSGKIQRRAAGERLASGALPVLGEWRAAELPLLAESGGSAGRSSGSARRRADRAMVPPRDPVEQRIAGIFRQALRVDRVGATDRFSELGGDSILRGEVLSRIDAAFGVALGLDAAFASFTVEALAKQVAQQLASPAPGAAPDLATPSAAPPDQVVLLDEERFRYKRLEASDVEGAVAVLIEAFPREPMGRASGLAPEDFAPFARFLCDKAAREGLSLVVVDREVGTVVACALSEDYAEALGGEPPPLSPKMAAIGAVLGALDEAYTRERRVAPGAILHLNLAAVRRDHEASGLTPKLVELSLDLGKSRGFTRALGHIAAAPLQELFVRRYGFHEVARVDYATFVHDGERVFAAIESPAGTRLLERRLDDWRASAPRAGAAT
jgi:acyl-CoA synthetase (AMP-forming)/AMP-acid ligase II/alkanesulfonate monooxygenase SsuD/methylene tetrahydromethanopterin reductase-like flavin-dependent oxidoreductase (luciferase family)/acyl carrier protein